MLTLDYGLSRGEAAAHVRGFASLALLGTLRLTVNGTDVPIGPPRRRALFVFLAVNAGRAVSRDELVDAVWGEDAPGSAAGNVHTYVADLRKALRTAGADPVTALSTIGSGYRLGIEDMDIDLSNFEHHLAAAHRHARARAPERAIETWRRGLRLWRGTPLPGVDAPYADAERARLSNLRLAATAALVDALLARGTEVDTLVALQALDDVLDEHPLHEHFVATRMRILCGRGRRVEAIRQFERTREMLDDRFGVEPGRRLRDAYQDALAGAAVPVPAPVSGTRRRHETGCGTGLVGRSAELEALERASTSGGFDTRVMAIDGMPGVGKTALALEFARSARPRFPGGLHYVRFSGDGSVPEVGDARRPLRQAILSIGGPSTPIPDTIDELQHTYRGLLAPNTVVVLDDVRHIDQVRPLLPASGSLVVVVSRYRLTGIVARDGATRIPLGPLPADDARELLGRTLTGYQSTLDCRILDDLVERSGGVPLALRRCAQWLLATPETPPDELVQRLHSDPAALVRFRPDAHGDPHGSVADAFDVSVGALEPDPTTTLALLGSRPRDEITVARTAALTHWPATRAHDALELLATANLLDWGARERYHLNPLVHSYAACCLTTLDFETMTA